MKLISPPLISVFKREIKSYFYSPTAFVYITLFLFAVNIFTFYIGHFIDRSEANLQAFFSFHPYLFLIFMPALSMRLWSEEKKTGTLELLLTLPVSNKDLVLGKFFASWCFSAIAIMGTFPLWITVSILGTPDHLVILFSYLSSILLAGVFLAIGSYISARTSNQVIAFIMSTVISFIFLMTGFPMISNFFTPVFTASLSDVLIQFSLLIHYDNFIKGYFHLSSILYFISLIVFWLSLTELKITSMRKG